MEEICSLIFPANFSIKSGNNFYDVYISLCTILKEITLFEFVLSWDMENPTGQPLGHGGDFDLDSDHATPEVKEIVSEEDPEVFFYV